VGQSQKTLHSLSLSDASLPVSPSVSSRRSGTASLKALVSIVSQLEFAGFNYNVSVGAACCFQPLCCCLFLTSSSPFIPRLPIFHPTSPEFPCSLLHTAIIIYIPMQNAFIPRNSTGTVYFNLVMTLLTWITVFSYRLLWLTTRADSDTYNRSMKTKIRIRFKAIDIPPVPPPIAHYFTCNRGFVYSVHACQRRRARKRKERSAAKGQVRMC
jgi:hypothetical protein